MYMARNTQWFWIWPLDGVIADLIGDLLRELGSPSINPQWTLRAVDKNLTAPKFSDVDETTRKMAIKKKN